MSSRNPELEAQILKSPDDASLYQVYADWLSEQGDPRGELISLSLAHEAKPNPDAQKRLAELHAKHDEEWLGGATPSFVDIRWKRGFVDSVTFGDDDQADIELAGLYKVFRDRSMDRAAYALVRAITLGAFNDEDEYMPDWTNAVGAMLEYGVPSSLRYFGIDRGGYWDISSTQVGDISPLYAHMPNLETLSLEIGRMGLGKIDLPTLKTFTVYTGGFDGDNMKSVVDANWPRLETLTLRFGSSADYGGTCTADDVRPLLQQQHPHLRHLALANAAFTNDIIEDLAKSPLLGQLETLDLSWGFLDDKGVEQIVKHVDAFKHLRTLQVADSYIKTPEVLAKALPQTVGLDDQKASEADDNWRYCHIGE